MAVVSATFSLFRLLASLGPVRPLGCVLATLALHFERRIVFDRAAYPGSLGTRPTFRGCRVALRILVRYHEGRL